MTVDRTQGVVAPAGFKAAGMAAGIKASGALDLTLLVNDGPSRAAAGVFTRNVVKAAPVLWSQQVLTTGKLAAVVLNSGGANACTGPEGFQDTHATAEHVAQVLGVGAVEVAVCSTGLIGERLPMDAVLSGVDAAAKALGGTTQDGLAAATAVMTTDSVPKQAALQHADGWSVGGFAKGAGMCAPNMATMLSVITTDAVVDDVDAALRAAVGQTFNRLDVDGGTSTNDTVLLLSSGASAVRPDPAAFTEALTELCADLVAQLQADAEGATKHVTILVRGAVDDAAAEAAARAVARDNLCKTAFFGSDPNWGRIAMAVGNAGSDVAFDPQLLDITINGVAVCVGGGRGQDRSLADLSGKQITVEIDLHAGPATATVLTTDLSLGYVEENSAYSS